DGHRDREAAEARAQAAELLGLLDGLELLGGRGGRGAGRRRRAAVRREARLGRGAGGRRGRGGHGHNSFVLFIAPARRGGPTLPETVAGVTPVIGRVRDDPPADREVGTVVPVRAAA